MTKRAIVGYPSQLGAVASVHTLSANSVYPAANLTDKIRITNPWRSTTAGADWIYYTFNSLATPVQLVCLVGHSLSTVATVRLRLYNSTAYDNTFSQPVLFDSGTELAWPQGVVPSSNYLWIRPFLLQEPVLCGSLSVDVNTGDGSNASVGALEVSGAWDLRGISPGRQRAFDARTPVTVLAGGADNVPDFWLPRLWSGGLDFIKSTTMESTFMDFLQAQDLVNPFVFCEDMINPAAWARTCMLVRNQKINAAVGATYRRDKAAFSFIEHQR